MDPLLEANATFALKVLRVLGEDSSKNVFFSPLSMFSSLSMILLGANGTTASQISKVLSLYNCNGNGGGDFHQCFQSLLTEVNKSDRRHMLKTSNSVFVYKDSFEILASFKDSCRKFYEAEIENMHFKGAPEQSRQHINTWVAKKTEDVIRELLSPGTVNSNTQLVLMNSFYFKGNWEKPFNKEDTREMPFNVSKNEKKIVQMMFNKSNFRTYHVEDISTTLALLPYLGNQLSITIMLPDEYVELRTVENQITYEKLIEWTRLENMQEEEVEIFLPRFKLEESYDMKDVLCKLDMTDAFEEGRADFSGISSKPGLFLSKVVHKSVVEVNEEGTEAAAPTEIVTMGSPLSPQCLVTDHSFLFLIQDDRSKAILFLGRFSSPC